MTREMILWGLMSLIPGIISSQPASFEPRGIGGGGSLFIPKINPLDDREFYVSCDMSELFHSTDFGRSYNQVNHTALQVFGSSTYEFTNDPSIGYCNYNDGNEGFPVKTTDGGNTWNRMNGYNSGQYGYVYRMFSNFDHPDQLLIGSYGDILFTGDGGISFKLVKHAADMGAGLIIGGVFWDEGNIYIGTNDGLIVSNDGGTTFSIMPVTGIPTGQVTWSFSGAREGGNTRFTCITSDIGDTYNGLMPWEYYNFAKGVYTMDNASGNWASKSSGISFGSDFIMYAAMAENDINTIYLGGHDEALSAPLVFRSSDGGNSWSKVFISTNNTNIITGWEGDGGDKSWSWSETVFGIAVAPGNSNKVLFGNYSNIEASEDGGQSWRQAYVSEDSQHPAGSPTPKKQPYASIGLENTTCWQLFWFDANSMMGCFSDIGGIRSTDGGVQWGFNYDGFSVNSLYWIAGAANGTMYGGCSNIHDIYQSTRLTDARLDAADGNGKIVFSTDGGASWATLHSFGHPVFWLALDPANPDRMYASVIHFGGIQGSQLGGIYRTDNLSSGTAATWNKLPNPPRTEGHPASILVLNDGKMVCTFSGRINPGGQFTASSGAFLYDPASNSWSDRSDPGMYYWTKDIVTDPTDDAQNTWYAGVFSGWGGPPNGLGGLYRTTDRGITWTKLTGSQFDRVTSVTFNPKNQDQVYLTTETQGLWMTNDIQATSPLWTLIESYPFRQPERIFFDPFNEYEMWVTSFGNGMKVGSLNPAAVIEDKMQGPEIRLWPNPFSDHVSFSFDNPNTPLSHIIFYTLNGQIILSVPATVNTLNTTFLSPGIYIVAFHFKDGRTDHLKAIKVR